MVTELLAAWTACAYFNPAEMNRGEFCGHVLPPSLDATGLIQISGNSVIRFCEQDLSRVLQCLQHEIPFGLKNTHEN